MLMWLDFPKNGMHRSNRHGLSWLCDSDGHWGWNLHVSYTFLRSVFWVCRNLDVSHVWILHITRVVDWMLNVARVIAWHIHGLIAGLLKGCHNRFVRFVGCGIRFWHMLLMDRLSVSLQMLLRVGLCVSILILQIFFNRLS